MVLNTSMRRSIQWLLHSPTSGNSTDDLRIFNFKQLLVLLLRGICEASGTVHLVMQLTESSQCLEKVREALHRSKFPHGAENGAASTPSQSSTRVGAESSSVQEGESEEQDSSYDPHSPPSDGMSLVCLCLASSLCACVFSICHVSSCQMTAIHYIARYLTLMQTSSSLPQN